MNLHPYDIIDYISCPEKFKRKTKGHSTIIKKRFTKQYNSKLVRSDLSKKLILSYFENCKNRSGDTIDLNKIWYDIKQTYKEFIYTTEDLLWISEKIKELPSTIPEATSVIEVNYPIVYRVLNTTIKFKIDAVFLNERVGQVRPVVIWDYPEIDYSPSNFKLKYYGQLVSEAFKKQIVNEIDSKRILKGYYIRPDTWKLIPFPISLKEKNLIPNVIKGIEEKIIYPKPTYHNCFICPFNVKGGCLWKFSN